MKTFKTFNSHICGSYISESRAQDCCMQTDWTKWRSYCERWVIDTRDWRVFEAHNYKFCSCLDTPRNCLQITELFWWAHKVLWHQNRLNWKTSRTKYNTFRGLPQSLHIIVCFPVFGEYCSMWESFVKPRDSRVSWGGWTLQVWKWKKSGGVELERNELNRPL